MLISIDHGNKQMKTAHKTFPSALTKSDTRPPFGDDILEYKGKYYVPSGNRIPYMRNKVEDERFFVLTLFAIAYEIEAVHAYDPDEIMDIQLAVGLPPAHFGMQASRFEAYFQNRDVISFVFRNKPYDIYINQVTCFPQASAAAVPMLSKFMDVPKAVIVDIGGFTADYLTLRNGKGDLSACDSLENGVILQDKPHDFDESVVQLVEEQAQSFIGDLVGKLRERMIDLRTGKAIFVGGGSLLLRRQIEASGKVGHAMFVDEIAANTNTKGYELLYLASRGGR